MLWSLVVGGGHPVTTQQRESKGNKYLDLPSFHSPNKKPGELLMEPIKPPGCRAMETRIESGS